MKTLGWLGIAAVLAIGGLVEYGGPVRGAAPVGRVAVSPADPGHGEPPAALRPAMAHLREEVRSGPDGTLVIANGAYRAAFSARDGVVYTPFHGTVLEPRLTWQYHARAIVTDAGTRVLDDVAPVVSPTGEHVVDFVRPGLIERYEGERTGVEQIFVLPARPAGAGDVRILGDVTFGGTIRAKDGGLEFDAGLPTFSYAKPIAFDALRRPVPVRVEASNHTLTLVLDGASLDGVQWPVTIDPLFGLAEVENTEETTEMDVAYNPRRNEFLVVYDTRHPNDPGQTDIRLRRYYEDGGATGPAVTISEGDGESEDREPQIACDAVVDRCLVVWTRHGLLPRAKALLLTGSGLVLGQPFAPGPFAVDTYHATREKFARVEARNLRSHTLAETCFLVTWGEDVIAQYFYAQFARVSGNGTPLGESHVPATVAVTNNVAYDPVSDRFLVVRRELYGKVAVPVSPSGAIGQEMHVTGEKIASDPRVAYDLASRRYLVAWTGLGVLRGRFFDAQAQPKPIGDEFPLTIDDDGEEPTHLEAVTGQNGTFVTTYGRTTSTGPEARLSRVDINGTVVTDGKATSGRAFDNAAVSAGGYMLGVGADDIAARLFSYGAWAPQELQGRGGDFDGDGKGDLYTYRPSTGRFFVHKSSVPPNSPLPPDVSFALGGEAHRPVALDWDGDGRADIGVFSVVSGRWTIRLSTTGTTELVTLGRWDDVPVPGDYLGAANDEVAVYRPSTGEWLIRERGSSATTIVTWGTLGDQPVPGDYDGDGKHELCVFRPGTGQWFRAEVNLTGQQITTHGQVGDTAFTGNFVGGPEADRVVFRRGVWHIADGATGTVTQVSTGGRIPVTVDWNGDGYQDPGVFNDMTGKWTIAYLGNYAYATFGQFGDLPAGGH